VQSARPHPESGRHYHYRPVDKKTGAGLSLTAEALRRHLEGEITIKRCGPRCGINPATQRCKRMAIDTDSYGFHFVASRHLIPWSLKAGTGPRKDAQRYSRHGCSSLRAFVTANSAISLTIQVKFSGPTE
jgi:hypothetical protein